MISRAHHDQPPPSAGIVESPTVLDMLGYTDAAAYVRLHRHMLDKGYITLASHYEVLAVEAARPLVLHLR